MTSKPIRYRIIPIRPEAHLFEVSCTVDSPDPQGQRFSLPAWIPGSYLIREFARHVVSIRANRGGRAVAIEKEDKHTWRVSPAGEGKSGALTVTCQVYAWDLSVRGAHLDTTHGFFNGTSVFLKVLGQEDSPCEVELVPPKGAKYRRWRVATALPSAGARAYGFGTYRASNYDELIDHPVEMGEFTLATFRARGVPHDVVITGRHDADMDRLCRDMKRVCEWQIDLFGGKAPFERYVFMTTALGEGYGGLEHRASTALVCARTDLPRRGAKNLEEGYRTFLGLVSHEYFHSWNVKRIKPAAFTPYDLDRENYTRLLWLFEGFTSYYDDLALLRSGLISQADYLETVGKSITGLLRTPGRKVQTVADSSFDAWIKYYRQDENTPNVVVSYYLKGSLVAMCLDLEIRKRTDGRRSLDDLMRALWREHGLKGRGVTDADVERIASRIAGGRLQAFFDLALRSTSELPFERLLASHGLRMEIGPAESSSDRGGKPARLSAASRRERPTLGLRGRVEGSDYKVTHVFDGSAAQAAGLSAGDAIVAVNGIRTGAGGLDAAIGRLRPGDSVELHVFRRDELHVLQARLSAPESDTCNLRIEPEVAVRLRHRWLGA